MRSIFHFAVGLLAGILTLRFAWAALKMFFLLRLGACLVNGLIACGLGLLTIRSFEEI